MRAPISALSKPFLGIELNDDEREMIDLLAKAVDARPNASCDQ